MSYFLFSLSPPLYLLILSSLPSLSLYPSRPSLKGDSSKTTVRIKQGPDCLQCQDYTAGMYRLMVKTCDVTDKKNVRNYTFHMHACIPSIMCMHTHTHTLVHRLLHLLTHLHYTHSVHNRISLSYCCWACVTLLRHAKTI